MLHRLFTLGSGLLLSLLLAVPPAHAHDVHVYEPPPNAGRVYVVQPAPAVRQVEVVQPQPIQTVRALPDENRSVLSYSLQGFVAGALVGISVGYLVVSTHHVETPWRSMVMATGIGALSGAGLGLGLGFLDAASDRRPAALRFVMRDATYGALLGGAFGATVGGLVALDSRNGRDALLGASIGAISGCVLGGLTGVLEGHLRARTVLLGVGTTQDVRGKHALGATLSGRF
jgi:hypothetical protein